MSDFNLKDCCPSSENVEVLLANMQQNIIEMNMPIDRTNKILQMLGSLGLAIQEEKMQKICILEGLIANIIHPEMNPMASSTYLCCLGLILGTMGNTIPQNVWIDLGIPDKDATPEHPTIRDLCKIIVTNTENRLAIFDYMKGLHMRLTNAFPCDPEKAIKPEINTQPSNN